MAKSVPVPTAAAAGMIYMTWVLSAIGVGLAASAVARNTHSAIGIAHLVAVCLHVHSGALALTKPK